MLTIHLNRCILSLSGKGTPKWSRREPTMKKLIKVRVIKSGTGIYYKKGTIKNCIEEDGEFYYYIKIDGEKGLTLLHHSDIEIL